MKLKGTDHTEFGSAAWNHHVAGYLKLGLILEQMPSPKPPLFSVSEHSIFHTKLGLIIQHTYFTLYYVNEAIIVSSHL